MKIALATQDILPELCPEEKDLPSLFQSKGAQAVPVVWTDPSIAWNTFDAVVVRSTWDYWQDLPKFLQWIEKLEKENVRIFNSAETLRWNTDKLYYKELEAKGFPTVQTLWTKAKDAETMLQQIRSSQWKEVVVKPSVSAGGYKAFRALPTLESVRQGLESVAYRTGETLMVQPFLPEIQQNGEWSLFFFNGKFSHSLVKRVRDGEFRVQEKFGGVPTEEKAPKAALKLGEKLVQYVTEKFETPLYARVDLVDFRGQFLLMELEITEPSLYFEQSEGSKDRFVSATLKKVNA